MDLTWEQQAREYAAQLRSRLEGEFPELVVRTGSAGGGDKIWMKIKDPSSGQEIVSSDPGFDLDSHDFDELADAIVIEVRNKLEE